VRDDYYREALEIIEMYCSLILTRSGLLDSKPQLDESLREPVYTLIWAAPRLSVDLREMNEVRWPHDL
jgi:vacuolar protein sorting-associated protein IST1